MTPANWPAYGSYKESGIEWIGSVPAAWSVERGKWLFVKKDRPTRLEDEVVTCFRDGQVTLRRNRRTDGFTNALKEHGYQGIRKGDLVIHAMDAFAGAIGVSDSDGKATPVYSACVPRQPGTVDPHFYAYYMRHLALSGLLVSLAKGIRERSTDFRYGDFADLQLVAPPLAEQRAISAFLDEKCAKVDEAVRIKEEQIALLRERRQILIQEAVTRGLNPDAPMKDSGIDWMGQIPAHWNVRRVKHVGLISPSRTLDRVIPNDDVVVFLPMEAVLPDGTVVQDDRRKSKEIYSGFTYFRKGDVVVAKITPCFENGKGAWLCDLETDYGFGTTELHVIRPVAVNGAFLHRVLNSEAFLSIGERFMVGSAGQKRVPTAFLADFPIPLPPPSEQLEVVAYIGEEARKIDRGIAIKESQIAALKEYKTTLINAAVTGKIKVA